MADSMFNVQPPAWLTEITTADPNKGGRQALQIGADIVQRNRQLQIQQELGEKRIAAQQLYYEGRLQNMDMANNLAQIRLETSQQQLALARDRLDNNKLIADRKAMDYAGFVQRYVSPELTLEDRQEVDKPNPYWTAPNTPPTMEQSTTLNRLLDARRAEKMKSQGLVAAETTVGPKGETTKYKPTIDAENYHVIEPSPGHFFLVGPKGAPQHLDLTATEKADLRRVTGDYERADRAWEKARLDPVVPQASKDQLFQERLEKGKTYSKWLQGHSGMSPSPSRHVLPGEAAAPASQNRIRVIGPDGTMGTIPESQLQDAQSQGYKLAP